LIQGNKYSPYAKWWTGFCLVLNTANFTGLNTSITIQ